MMGRGAIVLACLMFPCQGRRVQTNLAPTVLGGPRALAKAHNQHNVNTRRGLVLLATDRTMAPGRRQSRPVRLGLSNLLWPFATHWAVQVDDTWIEVPGSTKEDSNTAMDIKYSQGVKSSPAIGRGADASRFGRVGKTSKTDDEIVEWTDAWKARNPTYNFASDNCQRFSREFIEWLTDGKHKPLPMMDAGNGAGVARGPTTWAGAEAGSAYAGATVASRQGHRGLLNGALDGPNACASAICSRRGFGAFGEAELGRAEVGIGPVRVAGHLNINTGIGVRNKGLEASVAGFGFKAGANGVSVSVPLLTISLGRW